jgi:hypothetical protein
LKGAFETKEDEDRLLRLIDMAPGTADSIYLRCDLALRAAQKGRVDKARHHLDTVWKGLETLRTRDSEGYQDLVVEVAPALFTVARAKAQAEFDSLPPHVADDAYSRAAWGALKRCGLGEPFQEDEPGSLARSLDDLTTALDAISGCRLDASVYGIIQITCGVLSKAKRMESGGITREAKALLLGRCRDLANKLPYGREVLHDGWKILSLAAADAADGAGGVAWNTHVEEAAKIANLADRVFVLGTLAERIPSKFSQLIQRCKDECSSGLATLRSIEDRVDRAVYLADCMKAIGDKMLARNYLRQASTCLVHLPEPRAASVARSIVDCAYRVDPDEAEHLLERMNSDPARQQAREGLAERRAMDSLHEDHATSTVNPEHLASACRRTLGELNAGRRLPLDPARVIERLSQAATFPLHEAYWVFLWGIAHLRARWEGTASAARQLRPLASSLMDAAEIAVRLAGTGSRLGPNAELALDAPQATVLEPGTREVALLRFREWMAQQEDGDVVICDPYFGMETLDVVRALQAGRRDVKVRILTARTPSLPRFEDLPSQLREHWEREIATDHPPDIKITFMWVDGSRHQGGWPIHDRYVLGRTSGLHVGTSLKDIGEGRVSDIVLLDRAAVIERRNFLEQFLTANRRQYEDWTLFYAQIIV